MTPKKLLRFIHVGKCGGSTIEHLLAESPLVSQNYYSVIESHVCGVTLDTDCDYLFCLRNPISRAISAYEWRKKLVVIDTPPSQISRFRGEMQVLNHYESFSNFSERLYRPNGLLNQEVARDFELVHHLRESISFYLSPLIPILSTKNVYGIICQETLSDDCQKLLGVDSVGHSFRKNNLRKESALTLSCQATFNLKRYLVEDYICLTRLWSLGILSDDQFNLLML